MYKYNIHVILHIYTVVKLKWFEFSHLNVWALTHTQQDRGSVRPQRQHRGHAATNTAPHTLNTNSHRPICVTPCCTHSPWLTHTDSMSGSSSSWSRLSGHCFIRSDSQVNGLDWHTVESQGFKHNIRSHLAPCCRPPCVSALCWSDRSADESMATALNVKWQRQIAGNVKHREQKNETKCIKNKSLVAEEKGLL